LLHLMTLAFPLRHDASNKLSFFVTHHYEFF